MSITHSEIMRFISPLQHMGGSDRLFNPYNMKQDEGAKTRFNNLAIYLSDMFIRQPEVLMLFEAPGYRGCALSGIPVTSERIMVKGISQWQLFGSEYKVTSGQSAGVSEITATILWDALQAYASTPPLIWNTVPLHPHRPGQRQSNRTPNHSEQLIGLDYIQELNSLFRFRQVLAVGRVAQAALRSLNIQAIPLRHPAQGGKAEFVTGLRQALD